MTALLCSQCGAGLTQAGASCLYCGTVYARGGTKPTRGAPAPRPQNRGRYSHSRLNCPRCHVVLHTHRIAKSTLDRCARCGGLWVAHDEMDDLLERKHVGHHHLEPLNVAGGDYRRARQRSKRRRAGFYGPLRCPRCHDTMDTELASRTTDTHVDVCDRHGTWFDAEELTDLVRLHSPRYLRQRVFPTLASDFGRRWRFSGLGDWDDRFGMLLLFLLARVLKSLFR